MLTTAPRLAEETFATGGARAARAVGAAHRARPRSGGLRLHDAGDRVRAPARRDARSARRRREARGRPGGDRPRRRRRDADRGRGRADRRLRRQRDGGAARRRRDDRGLTGGARLRHARPSSTAGYCPKAVPRRTSATRRVASATAAARCRSTSRSRSCRAGAATSGLARTPIVARHARARRRLARGQRGRARPPPRRGDDRLSGSRWRSIRRARPRESGSSGSSSRSCRRSRRAMPQTSSSRRRLGRAAPRGLRRSNRGAARRHIENLELGDARARRARPPTSRRRTRTSSAATSTAARARSTRTCSGGPPRDPGHRRPVERLFHIGASTHPGPGLGAGSGYLAAKRLTRPPLPRRLLSKLPGL